MVKTLCPVGDIINIIQILYFKKIDNSLVIDIYLIKKETPFYIYTDTRKIYFEFLSLFRVSKS